MSNTVDLEGIYSAIEESAALLDVTSSREKVWPILSAFEYALGDAVIACRVATNARHEGEFDGRFTVPAGIDPYGLVVSKGIATTSGHPIESLLSGLQELCTIDTYGIDFGVVAGFKKIWAYFPGGEHESLSRLITLPSMPRSVVENLEFFERYGLADKVDLIGIDYHSRTMNLYFAAPAECFEEKTVLAMHRDIGIPDPSEDMIDFCEKSFGLYTTLSWDSPKIERISYGVKSQDPTTVTSQLGPKIEKFVKSLPYGADDPKMVYAAVTSTGEEYYKLQTYLRWKSVSRLNVAYIGAAGEKSA